MITAALAFVTSRKWLIEGLLAVAVLGGIYLAGVHHANVRWESRLAEQQALGKIETARLAERANIAEKARAIELQQLDDYRAQHVLTGRLCPRPAGVPQAAAPVSGDAGASPAASAFLAMPERSAGTERGRDDQQHLLDLLAARADSVSAQLREWQARQ